MLNHSASLQKNMFRCAWVIFKFDLPWLGMSSILIGNVIHLLIITAVDTNWKVL